jgi:hypothetical protein
VRAGDGRRTALRCSRARGLFRKASADKPDAQMTISPAYRELSYPLPIKWSHSARDDVAVHLSLEPEEDYAVPGRITFIPFQLVIGHGDFGPVRNVSLPIRDDGDVTILGNLEEVRLVCVGLATARNSWVVWLLQFLKPPSYMRRRGFPLAIVSCHRAGSSKAYDNQCNPGADD